MEIHIGLLQRHTVWKGKKSPSASSRATLRGNKGHTRFPGCWRGVPALPPSFPTLSPLAARQTVDMETPHEPGHGHEVQLWAISARRVGEKFT